MIFDCLLNNDNTQKKKKDEHNEQFSKDNFVLLERYVRSSDGRFQNVMDRRGTHEHRGMHWENDGDRGFYLRISIEMQRYNLNNQSIEREREGNVFVLPSSRTISNSVVNRRVIGNCINCSSETSNGDMDGVRRYLY